MWTCNRLNYCFDDGSLAGMGKFGRFTKIKFNLILFLCLSSFLLENIDKLSRGEICVANFIPPC